jgi:K+-sensing histidine kinase KdpD
MIIYTIDTMVIIGLLLLSLARRRFQLAEENNKYFITQVELAKAVSATNITNKEKMRFLEQISRDLQSPVSSILKCNQKLNVVELNSGQKILSSSIEQAAKKIRELINCLVDLSNLETGKISVKMNKVGFEEILKDELPTLQALVLPFSIKLILNPLNVAAQQSGKILVDRAIIMKALCYILKSMTTLNIDSGEIQIEYGTFDANIYRILIRENAAASNNDNYIEKTTDIILIIVKSFVEIMDGEIVFDYSKKNGNQFIIDFPLQD